MADGGTPAVSRRMSSAGSQNAQPPRKFSGHVSWDDIGFEPPSTAMPPRHRTWSKKKSKAARDVRRLDKRTSFAPTAAPALPKKMTTTTIPLDTDGMKDTDGARKGAIAVRGTRSSLSSWRESRRIAPVLGRVTPGYDMGCVEDASGSRRRHSLVERLGLMKKQVVLRATTMGSVGSAGMSSLSSTTTIVEIEDGEEGVAGGEAEEDCTVAVAGRADEGALAAPDEPPRHPFRRSLIIHGFICLGTVIAGALILKNILVAHEPIGETRTMRMSKFMLRDSGCETDDDDLTCEDGLPGLDIDDVEVTYASGVMMSAPTAALKSRRCYDGRGLRDEGLDQLILVEEALLAM